MMAVHRIVIEVEAPLLNTGDPRLKRWMVGAGKEAEQLLDGKIKTMRCASYGDDIEEMRREIAELRGPARCVFCQHLVSAHVGVGEGMASVFGKAAHAVVDQFGWTHFAGLPIP